MANGFVGAPGTTTGIGYGTTTLKLATNTSNVHMRPISLPRYNGEIELPVDYRDPELTDTVTVSWEGKDVDGNTVLTFMADEDTFKVSVADLERMLKLIKGE